MLFTADSRQSGLQRCNDEVHMPAHRYWDQHLYRHLAAERKDQHAALERQGTTLDAPVACGSPEHHQIFPWSAASKLLASFSGHPRKQNLLSILLGVLMSVMLGCQQRRRHTFRVDNQPVHGAGSHLTLQHVIELLRRHP